MNSSLRSTAKLRGAEWKVRNLARERMQRRSAARRTLGHLASERMPATRRGVAHGKKSRHHARNAVTAAGFPHIVFVARSAYLASERKGTAQVQHCVRDSAFIMICLPSLPTALLSSRQPRSSGALQAHPAMGPAHGLPQQPSCTVRAARSAPGAQQLCSNFQSSPRPSPA